MSPTVAWLTSILPIEARSTPLELVVNDGSVPESDTTDNVHKIEIPQKAK